MKKFLVLLAVAFSAFACGPKEEPKNVYMMTGFHEPADSGMRLIYSHDGYHWTDLGCVWIAPEVGTQKVMRDPSIVQGPDGTFHLVWTSSWRQDNGFGHSSSKDLINWTPQDHIDVMTAYDTLTNNVWAPELFYDDADGYYYIYWSSAIPGKYEGHRQYYTKTKDWLIFTPAELFYDPGYNSIDGAVMKRGKDDYVLAVKDNRKPGYSNIHLAFGTTPGGPWSGETTPFGPEYSEGPTWCKVPEGWLIYYDAYRQYRFGAHLTTDFQNFTDVSDKIDIPKGHKHGTVFMTTESILNGLKAAAPEKIRQDSISRAAAAEAAATAAADSLTKQQ